MLAQKSPNAWSCLLTAFSIVLDIPIEILINRLGHDGSDITHIGLPEPFKRRGFHSQEFIKLCIEDGLAVTYIELIPWSVPKQYTLGSYYQPKKFDTGNWSWFSKNLFSSIGVLDCRTALGTGHALAYHGADTYANISDPATGKNFNLYTLDDAERRNRFIIALWRLDKIIE